MQRYDVSAEVQNFLQSATGRYGPLICQVLVHRIAGEASRSELDMLAQPLKKIISCQQSAKAWLADALNSSTFPSQRVSQDDKRIWLNKIMRYNRAAVARCRV